LKLRRSVLAALTIVPLLLSAAAATPLAPGEPYKKAIRYLGPNLPPLNYVGAAAAPTPGSSNGIGPGQQIVMERPDGAFICTANFIWTSTTTTSTQTKKHGKGEPKGKGKNSQSTTTTTTKNYLGAAGHCFVPEGLSATHGPDADYDPTLTSVSVCVSRCEFGDQTGPIWGDFVRLGPVAYARQTRGGVDVGQDFGVVEIPERWSYLIRPDMPVWGGPSKVEDVTFGGGVCVYGNGIGVGEVFLTKARTGIGRGISDDGTSWNADIPSAQGDSGSALVTCTQNADGIQGVGAAGALTHISPGQAGIVGTTTGQAVRMAQEDAGLALQLKLADGSSSTPAPPPSPTPQQPNATVGVGQEYNWTAGPFTRTAPPDAVLGEACGSDPAQSEYCDYEFIKATVPQEGAVLTVTISTADADTTDFDLFLFGPNGGQVDSAASAGTPPETISATVREPGLYTVAVDPYDTNNATYSGSFKLEAVRQPNGSIGVGQQYNWSAGPFTHSAPLLGEECDGQPDAEDPCDYEFVKVEPQDGSFLTVKISAADENADFDLFVFDPSGNLLDSSAQAGTPPEVVSVSVRQPGVYTIGVDPFDTDNATYSGSAKLEIPQEATLSGTAHIYQLGRVDPFASTGSSIVAAGEPVKLSLRSLLSNDASVQLAIDAAGTANFSGVHQIRDADGNVVFGPFDAVEGAEAPIAKEVQGSDTDPDFRTDSDWTVPADAASGSYVFEAYVTVGGKTYLVATLPFEIL
jgi:hypothetical protein